MGMSYPDSKDKELIDAIASLKNKDEVKNFLRDLLTVAEIKEFSNRFQAAKMVYQGNSYLEIAKKLGISTTTVTRVAHWLHHGMNGYLTILKRLYSPKK